MTEHAVRDGQRTLRLEGALLAEASSRQDGASRWTELRLFRTDSGRYVLEGVGRSEVPGEVDRPWVKTADLPDPAWGAVELLHMYDDDGVRFMTRAARRVAEAAALVDPAFAAAWNGEVLD